MFAKVTRDMLLVMMFEECLCAYFAVLLRSLVFIGLEGVQVPLYTFFLLLDNVRIMACLPQQ